ncbi:hypothetical protein EDD22DRAFT_855170 [Suillus occidentalis]|nr:hypothetical protein EDD22DRAFT_855170 [Suillus occidentalis]
MCQLQTDMGSRSIGRSSVRLVKYVNSGSVPKWGGQSNKWSVKYSITTMGATKVRSNSNNQTGKPSCWIQVFDLANTSSALLAHSNHQATRSTMPVRKAYADAIASKHFSKKVFDMCWDVEPEPEPLVEPPMALSSAKPQYSGQMFDMCWDFASNAGPMVNAPANASTANALAKASLAKPQYGSQVMQDLWSMHWPMHQRRHQWTKPDNSFQGSYVEAATPLAATTFNVCWDDGLATSATEYLGGLVLFVEISQHHQLLVATAPAITVEAATLPATTFNVCWDDQLATLAIEYKGGFDMCWEDNLTTTGLVNSVVNHPEPSGSQDQRASQTPSSTSTEVSVMAKVKSGKPLVRRAADRLARISTMMGDNPTEAATSIIEDNQALLTKYQQACNQYMTATTDIANIQHMLHIFK